MTVQAISKKRLLVFTPLIGFVVLVFFLAIGFRLAKHQVHPSAVLHEPFPMFSSVTLFDEQPISQENLLGSFRLVNVWASWCAACVVEHDLLLELADSDAISIIGINYRDNVEDAKTWLFERRNPYEKIVVDSQGDLCVDLGVYGAPETFLLDPEGFIRAKQVGVLTRAAWLEEFQPWLEARGEQN